MAWQRADGELRPINTPRTCFATGSKARYGATGWPGFRTLRHHFFSRSNGLAWNVTISRAVISMGSPFGFRPGRERLLLTEKTPKPGLSP
ncbi:hypothetical protein SIID45300_01262 [Candidatus Magnetaquicoccaceae bacterium FCR-1]|uniref:Uncharacterized protein n=1 Tax=Candidatus Magnetaquiglobus chichijimensis TaxID=3141448 RepID=A0ABQ0C7U1_9PROT